ncbi:MAG: hypothetical protein OHK0023_24940 [Anaerolineae bacterium]
MYTILIVEDDAHIRGTLSDVLRMMDYRTLEAAQGDEGLKRALQELPDLILCDAGMPNYDGIWLYQQLQAHVLLHKIPFAMMTAQSLEAIATAIPNFPVDCLLIKPFTIERLTHLLSRLLKLGEGHNRQR